MVRMSSVLEGDARVLETLVARVNEEDSGERRKEGREVGRGDGLVKVLWSLFEDDSKGLLRRKSGGRLFPCLFREPPTIGVTGTRSHLCDIFPSYLPPEPILPPLRREVSERICLVLDMDETLIRSSFEVDEEGRSSNDAVVTLRVGLTAHKVNVRKRPGLEAFLDQVTQWYEVVVFTASIKLYADAVLDEVDPYGRVHHRLFREHCAIVNGTYVKDLRRLGRPLNRIIMVDNSPTCYALQPSNALPIGSFYGDESDTALLDMLPILEAAKDLQDVRYARLGPKRMKTL